MFDFIGLAKALAEAAQPLLAKALFNEIMENCNELEANEKEIMEEELKYPNWDDQKLGRLKLNRARLKKVVANQTDAVKASVKV